MVPLSKSGVRKHRGFESRPLRHRLDRQARPAGAMPVGFAVRGGFMERSPSGLWRRTGNAVRGNPSRVRIPPSPPATRAGRTPVRALADQVLAPRANGLAELSLGPRWANGDSTLRVAHHIGPFDPSALDFGGRARRGTSGALYLQSAPAGLNSHPRSPFSRAAASSDVEDRVPRSGESRTVSGPEGSSTKRSSSGAAERPGPSRSSRWARVTSGRRWVHGNDESAARDRTGAS